MQQCGLQESRNQPGDYHRLGPRVDAHGFVPFRGNKDQTSDIGSSRPVSLAGVLKAKESVEQKKRKEKG